jgi:hypothetical protein
MLEKKHIYLASKINLYMNDTGTDIKHPATKMYGEWRYSSTILDLETRRW